MRVLFLLPHPDDESALCPVTLLKLVRAGHDVTVCLATSDEYGVEPRGGVEADRFKGHRMRRIRVAEMYAAARAYGVDERGKFGFTVAWLGFVDGHLLVNREARDRVVELLRRKRPDAFVSTDPFFPLDFHPDHVNVGLLALLAVRKLPVAERPRLFFVQSFRPDHFQPFRREEARVAWQAFGEHRSQVSPLTLKLFNAARWFYFFVVGRGRAGRPAEGFRLARLEAERGPERFRDVVVWHAMRRNGVSNPRLYRPTPEELGLRVRPLEEFDGTRPRRPPAGRPTGP
ncbi:MAG: hypothetical protein Kow0069_13280 [Promethearchaeota archaeon]